MALFCSIFKSLYSYIIESMFYTAACGLALFLLATLNGIYVVNRLLPNQKGFLSLLPSLPLYPNNAVEVEQVRTHVNMATQSDIEFFTVQIIEGLYGFREMFMSIKIYGIPVDLQMHCSTLVFIKLFVNRARPKQVDPSLKYENHHCF